MAKRSEEAIGRQINRAANVGDKKGSLFRGQTYEDGVRAALEWVNGDSDDEPCSDDDGYDRYDA